MLVWTTALGSDSRRRVRKASTGNSLQQIALAPSNKHSAGRRLLEPIPAGIAGSCHTLNAKRELARIARVEQGAVIRDDALRVPRHQRLVEALHAVLDGAFADEVRNVQRLVQVPDLFAHGCRVDEDFAGRHTTGAV